MNTASSNNEKEKTFRKKGDLIIDGMRVDDM